MITYCLNIYYFPKLKKFKQQKNPEICSETVKTSER